MGRQKRKSKTLDDVNKRISGMTTIDKDLDFGGDLTLVGLSGEVYDTPLHRQPVFEGAATGPLPGAEWLCERHICLPVTAVMTDEDVDLVVASLDAALGRA